MQMQGDELRSIREAAGLTQDQLAAELGLSRKAVNEMESGKAAINRRTALAASVLAPMVPGILIGGKADGQLVLVIDGLNTIRVSNPYWMPPMVSAHSPGSSAPQIAYRLIDLGDEVPERIFVPIDDETDPVAIRARVDELRAARQV